MNDSVCDWYSSSVESLAWEVLAEYQRKDSHELDKNVQTWTACVLQRVTNCVTDHSCFVDIWTFSHFFHRYSALLIFFFLFHMSTFDVLLGVVPGTTRVTGRYSHLHSRYNSARKEPEQSFRSYQESQKEWSNCDLSKVNFTSKPGSIIYLRAARVLTLIHPL